MRSVPKPAPTEPYKTTPEDSGKRVSGKGMGQRRTRTRNMYSYYADCVQIITSPVLWAGPIEPPEGKHRPLSGSVAAGQD